MSRNGLVQTRLGFSDSSVLCGPTLETLCIQPNGLTVGFVHLLSLNPDVEDRKANTKGHGHTLCLQKQGPCSGMRLLPAPGL